MRPFTTEWKTFVADAIAKDPKRRTADERAAIALAQEEANKPDEFQFRRTLGALIDCENILERMNYGEAEELSPAELEAAKTLLVQADLLFITLARCADCDDPDLLREPDFRNAVFKHLQHQALTPENDNG